MIFIFSGIECLISLAYNDFSGPLSEWLLHIALSICLFGTATLLAGKSGRLSFLVNSVVLLICLFAYLVSYETEGIIGVPLKFGEVFDQLRENKSIVSLFGDYLSHSSGKLICGSVATAIVLGLLFSLTRRWPPVSRRPILLLVLVCASIVFAVGIRSPKQLRYDTRLTFYFSWPIGIGARGMERHIEEIDLRDALVRAEYHGVPAHTPTIVLIFADSLRADHFQEYGYLRETAPFLASLTKSKRLTKIDWAFSSCSDSFCGITTTLASRKLFDVSENSLKVNELLTKAGYENWAIVAGDHRKFDDLGLFYGKSFDHFIDTKLFPGLSQYDDAIIREGLKQVPVADKSRPKFFYFFLMSSHVLGIKPPESQVYQPSDIGQFISKWHNTDFNERLSSLHITRENALTALNNNYDNGIRSADSVIQDIFERLSALGYLDDALIFILGDHGDALGEHNHLGHTYRLYNEDMRVPFYILDTSGKPLQNTFFATQEDIAPTILERIGLAVPEFYSGHSLYSIRRERSVHQSEHEREPCYAAIRHLDESMYKYISCREGGRINDEVFEIISDPKELHDLKSEVPSTLQQTFLNDIQSLRK